MGGVEDKILSLLKIYTTENYSKPTRVDKGWKNPRKPKAKKQSFVNIIKAIEDRIIRDMKNLFEQEDDYKPVRLGNFYSNNDTESQYQSKNTLIKLNHTWKKSLSHEIWYMENSINNSNFFFLKPLMRSRKKVITQKPWFMLNQMKLFKNFLNHLFLDMKLSWKVQWKVVILSLIALICCITNVIK